MAKQVTISITNSQPAGVLARIGQLIRSRVLGPFSLKDPELNRIFGAGSRSTAGPIVNDVTAFMVAAFYDGVNQISSDVAKLPLDLKKRRKEGGSDDFITSKTYKLMKYSPNPETRTMVFRRTVQMHALVYGNGYAEIVRDSLNQPDAMHILHPHRVRPFYADEEVVQANGRRRRKVLRYQLDGRDDLILQPRDIFHIPGLSDDGVMGMELLAVAREALGLALASQQFAAAFFGNGTRFGGILTAEDRDFDPGDPEAEEVRKRVDELNARADKAFRLLVLGGAWKYHATGTKPSEAQMKEVREQQVIEIARYLNMPPHKLKELSRSTNNNIEAQDIDYYKGTLLNWVTLWEQELGAKLISPLEIGRQYFKHNVNAFMRATMKERAEALGILRDKGIINADEWRELEDMNPQEGGQGKLYLVQSAQIPVDKLNDLVESQIKINDAKAKAASQPPPAAPAPASDASDADERATRAESLAEQYRDEAAAEREKRIAAEASGTATAEALARLTESEAKSQAIAAQLTVLAAELRTRADAEQAARETLDTQLAEVTAAADDARSRLEAAGTALESIARDKTSVEEAMHAAEARAQQAEDAARVAIQEAEVARAAADAATTDREAKEAEAQTWADRAADAIATATSATQDLERIVAESTERMAREAEAEASRVQAAADLETLRSQMTALQQAVDAAEAAKQSADARAADAAGAEQIARAEMAIARAALDAGATKLAELEVAAEAQRAIALGLEAKLLATGEVSAELDSVRATLTSTTEELTSTREALETQLNEARTALDVQRAAERARMAATIAAHRGLILDAVGRMTRRECEQARNKQATPAKLRRWLDGFPAVHETICVEALLPAMRTHIAWSLSSEDPATVTRALVREHIGLFTSQIVAVLESDPADFHGDLERVLERWETERAATVADAVLLKEIDHVRQK